MTTRSVVTSSLKFTGGIFLTDLVRLRNIRRHTLSQTEHTTFIQANALHEVHIGERECLYLCQHLTIPIILTDDLAVRDAAKRLQLTPVGSLGIIARAYRLRRMARAEAARAMQALDVDASRNFEQRDGVIKSEYYEHQHP